MSSSPIFDKNFHTHTASMLAEAFKTKKISITKYLEDLFSYIEKNQDTHNSLTSVQKNVSIQRAEILAKREPLPSEFLYGVPVIIKENIQKIGYPVECASKILKGYTGQYDATAIKLLESAGAIVIATANMDEFAMGSSNEHSTHGPVLNPHDPTRVSGGSSGGSGAACALGFAPITLGSDTGGSVRLPAAFCGIFGFKPSYGRVSRFGLIAYGSSLDQISPFAKSSLDLDLCMQIIGQHDKRDATSQTGSYTSCLGKISFNNIKVGIPRKLLLNGVDKEVLDCFLNLENEMKKRGVTFVDIHVTSNEDAPNLSSQATSNKNSPNSSSLENKLGQGAMERRVHEREARTQATSNEALTYFPMSLDGIEHTLSVYYIIACAEASSNLARFDGIRFGLRAPQAEDLNDLYSSTRSSGFGNEVKKRIMLGTYALSSGYYDAYYGRAQSVRNLMKNSFKKVFEQVDFIYLPTGPSTAFKCGEMKHDALKEYLFDVFTIPANLCGIPAISVPVPVPKNHLPVGLQFFAKEGDDARLIAFSHLLETENLIKTTELKV